LLSNPFVIQDKGCVLERSDGIQRFGRTLKTMLENTMLTTRFKPVLLKRKGVALGIWGEAGIGKSYQVTGLLRELLCRQASFHATTPLTTLAKTLPRPEKLALWATRGLERLEQGETSETSTILDALGATLAGLAPFVLHLEDLHEADTERLEFIQNLARMVQRIKGVGLIVTSRTEQPEPFVTVRLEPLTPESSRLLLEQELTATLPGEAPLWIYSKAAGNPLYTLEYLRYLTRQGFLWSDGKSWHWRKPEGQFMPVTVEALIEQLLVQAKTEPLQRYVLESKALLPLNASDELWCKVARVNTQELETAVTALSHQGVFQEKGFAHPLFREVALKTMGVARKRDLSRRAINALKDEPDEAAMFVEAAGLEPEQSLEILKRAAEQTKERNKVEAAIFLAKAVDYATGEEKGILSLEAARGLEGVDYQHMLLLAEEAALQLPDASEALYLVATAQALQGNYEAVQKVVTRIPEPVRQTATWTAQYIKLLHLSEKRDELIGYWEAHPESHETCDGATAGFVASMYLRLGKPLLASELVSRVLGHHALTNADKASLIETSGLICFYAGDYLPAETYFCDALALRQQDGFQPNIANVLRNRAVTRMQLGRFREGLPDLGEALKIYSEAGNSLYYAETLLMTSYVYVELGDYERTEEILQEALELLRRVEPQPKLLDVLVQLTGLYTEWPSRAHSHLALKYALEAESTAQILGGIEARLLASFALARVKTVTGKASEGLSYAEEALELAKEIDFFEATVNSHHARGFALKALGQTPEAKEAFTIAYTSAKEHSLALEAQKSGLELDHLNNDLESARTRMNWFEERGLMNGANIAKRYFPELAETKPSPEIVDTNLRLEVLGSMQFFANGKGESVRGRKRKELLACLLEARMAGRSHLSQLDLADKLHPENPDENLETLKQLVYQVRVAFGQAVIITTGNGYALGAISSDAETFLENGDTNLWRGEYLEGIANSDSTVSDALHHALSGRIEDLLETDPSEAARVGRLLVNAEPYELESWRLTLKAVRQSSTVQSVEKLYHEGCKRMAEVGEVLPASWEVFLSQSASVST
jgi:tetratricopeptide (TPR) repeat protein